MLRRKPGWRESRKQPVCTGLSRKKHASSWRGTWTRTVYFKLGGSAACVQAEPAQRERLEIQKREGLIQERSSRGERRAVPGKSEVEGGCACGLPRQWEGRAQVRTSTVYWSQDPGRPRGWWVITLPEEGAEASWRKRHLRTVLRPSSERERTAQSAGQGRTETEWGHRS